MTTPKPLSLRNSTPDPRLRRFHFVCRLTDSNGNMTITELSKEGHVLEKDATTVSLRRWHSDGTTTLPVIVGCDCLVLAHEIESESEEAA